MRKLIIAIVITLSTAASLMAQSTTSVKEVTLESTHYGTKILPLGTTKNNNIVVFYDHYDGSKYVLKTRLIGPKSNMGAPPAPSPALGV